MGGIVFLEVGGGLAHQRRCGFVVASLFEQQGEHVLLVGGLQVEILSQ